LGAKSLVNSIGGLIFSKGDEKSSGSNEPPQLKAGKDAHENEEVRPGEKKEVPTPSGEGRMDRYDAEKVTFEKSNQTTREVYGQARSS